VSGSATLGSNLVDRLVPKVIDGLRRKLHPKFGVRAYKVFTIARTWSGGGMGEGTASDVVVELDPQPKVKIWDGLRYSLEPCGLDEAGEIMLTEISLTYTQAELDGGGSLSQNQEFLIRVDEAHGQEQRSCFYIHTRRPFVDREKDMAWVAWLRKVDV
jgi:hypothetical protein